MIWPIGVILLTFITQQNETVQRTAEALNPLWVGNRTPIGAEIRGRQTMRWMALATSAGVALAVMTAPATAAWRPYISHPLGFAFAAPGELKVEKGTYQGPLAGQRETTVYRFLDDDIEYKV